MLKSFVIGLYGLFLFSPTSQLHANPEQIEYLKRFQQFQAWMNHLPSQPDESFNQFIKGARPLSVKLREQWLLKLANTENWSLFLKTFSKTDNTTLNCYQAQAYINTQQKEFAIKAAKKLWLIGHSQPDACNNVFNYLQSTSDFTEDLITKRIKLALKEGNLSLVRYLLKQYNPSKIKDVVALNHIYKHPDYVRKLKIAPLHDDFYLYALNRLVNRDTDKSIQYYHHIKSKKLLTDKQLQRYLAHLSLYKAIRNQKDAYLWFEQVKPEFYSELLVDWQLRFALKQLNWPLVIKLYHKVQHQDDPMWKYWYARALSQTNQNKQAQEIFKSLSKKRQYYGFLASHQAQLPFHFEQAFAEFQPKELSPYDPILESIKTLVDNNQINEASILINDFMSELQLTDKVQFNFWLLHELKWYFKSIYFSGLDDRMNDLLVLRFPNAYKKNIEQFTSPPQLRTTFIQALIRQESMFRSQIISHANAFGLMQLLPSTALLVSRKKNIPYQSNQDLFKPEKNIQLGINYLSLLFETFKHPTLVMAAYNAGPNRVKQWLSQGVSQSVDIWIETLPWHETRNYLKNIIAFDAVYQHLNHKPVTISNYFKPLPKIKYH